MFLCVSVMSVGSKVEKIHEIKANDHFGFGFCFVYNTLGFIDFNGASIVNIYKKKSEENKSKALITKPTNSSNDIFVFCFRVLNVVFSLLSLCLMSHVKPFASRSVGDGCRVSEL